MQRRKFGVLILICLFLVIFSPALRSTAQSDSDAIVVGVRGAQFLMVTGGETETLIEEHADQIQIPLDTNERGDVLYMISTDDQEFKFAASLNIFDGETIRHITDNFASEFPPYFEDADHVVYASTEVIEIFNDEEGRPSYSTVPVLSHDLNTDTTEQISMTIRYLSWGGGGGTGYAMEYVLADEHYSLFSTIPIFFHANFTSFEEGQIVAMSPDQQYVLTFTAGQESDTIDLVRVSPRSVSPLLELENGHDSIFWGTDGYIYYSVSTDLEPAYPLLTREESDELREILGLLWNWESSHHSQIIRLDPDTGEETVIYETDHIWAISRIQSVDGYLYWAEVPDGTPVIEAYRNGTIGTISSEEEMMERFLLPDVYRMPIDGGEVELVGTDLRRFLAVPNPSE